MPQTLDEKQKSWVIQQMGYDPSQYDLDEFNAVVPKVTNLSPSTGPETIIPKIQAQSIPKNTPLQTAGKSFLSAIPGMLGSGVGAGLVTGALAGSEVPILGNIVGGIAGAVLGGMAGKGIQHAIEPASWEQNVEQAQAENPRSAMLGNIAAMPFGGFNPNPMNVVRAFGTGGKLLGSLGQTAGVATEGELGNLLNVGLGAGIGGAQPIAESVIRGQPLPSMNETLLNTLLGATFNKPNRLGNMMGFHDAQQGTQEGTSDMLANVDPNTVQQQQSVNATPGITPDMIKATMGAPREREAFLHKDVAQNKFAGDIGEQPIGTTGAAKELVTPNETAIQTMEGEGGAVQKDVEDAQSYQRELNRQKAKQNDEQLKKLKELEAAKHELTVQDIEQQTASLKEQIEQNRIKAEPPIIKGTNPQRTNTKNVEAANKEVAAETDLLERQAEGLGDKYQEANTLPKTAAEQKNEALLKTKAPIPAWNDFMRLLGIKRGVSVEEVPGLANAQGKPVVGLAKLKNNLRKALINPELAGADTAPHELHHFLMNDLRNSKLPRDRQVVQKALSVVEKTADFKRWQTEQIAAGHTQATPEEYLTTDVGRYAVERAATDKTESPLKRWWNDYKAYLATYYGKHATPEDFTRLMTYRLYHDKAFDASGVNVPSGADLQNLENKEQPANNLIEKTVPEWLKERLEERRKAGWDSKWPFVPADLGNADFVAAIKSDPTLDVFEKEKILSFAPGGKNEIKLSNNKEQPLNDLPKQTEKKETPRRFSDETGKRQWLITKEPSPKERGEGWRVTKFIKQNDEYVPTGHYNHDTYEDTQAQISHAGLEELPYSFGRDLFQSSSSLPKLIRPEIEKIRSVEHKDTDKVADAFGNFYSKQRAYHGSLVNKPLEQLLKEVPNIVKNPKQNWMLDTPEFQDVVQYLRDMRDSGKSTITPNAKVLKIVQDSMADTLAARNALPGLRHTVKGDKYYFPDMPARQVLDTLLNHPSSSAANKLWDDFHDFYKNKLGKTQAEEDEAVKIFNNGYLKQKVNLADQYGPIDKAEGLGLPPSWRSDGLVDIISRFTNRYSRRLAYHEAVETNPEVMRALSAEGRGTIAAATPVKNVAEDIAGVRENIEANRSAASGLVRAGMMGTLTGTKDLLTAHTLPFQHIDAIHVIPAIVDAWTHIKDNWKGSFETGVNKSNIGSFEFTEGEGGLNAVVENLRRARDVINTLQGRNVLEKTSRSVDFGIGKFTAAANLQAAIKGKMSYMQQKFLNDFAPKNWRDYKKQGSFPKEVLNEIAAKFVESVQGTYDYRGLPSIAQKGTLAPYLSLARWNIEKLNNFDKYVIGPSKEGNFQPLLMATLGMVIGGEAVNQIVQLATNRKEKNPDYKEIAQLSKEGNVQHTLGAATYKLAALASYAGYAGIMGDVSKMALDKVYKNNIQSYNNPLIGGIQTVAQNAGDIVEAIQGGDLNITGAAISQFLEDSFQAYRLVLAHTSEEKQQKQEDTNKLRDLKVFKTTHGLPVGEVSADRANPFLDKDVKAFKKTGSLSDAAELLPKLLEDAMKKADGNVDILKSELAKIKANNYQTMPSIEEHPKMFMDYYNFLRDTQGEKAASERMSDYLLKNEVNKVKSSLVPSV